MKNFIIVALCALCIVLLFKNCGRQTDKVTIKTDTVTIIKIDTLRLSNVVYRDRWHIRNDTVIHQINDTTYIPVPIPIDRYLFTDDTTYRAEISGYNVTLNKMDVYRRTLDRTITIDKLIKPKPKRWGIGIQAGYGINTDGHVRPYIGVGVSYNLVRW